MSRWPAALLMCLGALSQPLPLAPVQSLAGGKLLVAGRKSRDPDLAQTVVLLVHYGSDGVVGLIVNRRSQNKPTGSVYFGGPINLGTRGLLRSRTVLTGSEEILPGVYLISDRARLEKIAPSSGFRVYAGYTGWSSRQLKDEVTQGLWTVLPGDARIVFDPNPDSLWSRLAP